MDKKKKRTKNNEEEEVETNSERRAIYRLKDKSFIEKEEKDRLINVSEFLKTVKVKNDEYEEFLRDRSLDIKDPFEEKIIKLDNNHCHNTIKFDWKSVLEYKYKRSNRGDALLLEEQKTFVIGLSINQPIILFHKKLESKSLNGLILLDIINLHSRKIGLTFSFYTVIKKEKLVVASVDMYNSFIMCGFMFSYIDQQDKISGENEEEEELIFSQKDMNDDLDLTKYLTMAVDYKTYFYYTCECINQ